MEGQQAQGGVVVVSPQQQQSTSGEIKERAQLFESDQQKIEVVDQLSIGLVKAFNTPLEDISQKLLELQQTQEELISTLAIEREKLETMPFMQGIIDTKVQGIKKNMAALSERVERLKKRAEKLQAKKEAEMMAAAEKERLRQEREKQLTAQPSPHLIEKEAARKREEQKDKEAEPASPSNTAAPATEAETDSPSSSSSSSAEAEQAPTSQSDKPAQQQASGGFTSFLKTAAFRKKT